LVRNQATDKLHFQRQKERNKIMLNPTDKIIITRKEFEVLLLSHVNDFKQILSAHLTREENLSPESIETVVENIDADEFVDAFVSILENIDLRNSCDMIRK